MWTCFVLWIAVYYPPAWLALNAHKYLVIEPECITLPTGERVYARDIKSIRLKRNLAHHLVLVKTNRGSRKIVVTWAVGKLQAVREALTSNPRLAALLER